MQETHRGLMDEPPTQCLRATGSTPSSYWLNALEAPPRCLGGTGSLLDGSKQTTSFSVRNNPFPYDKLSVCCFGSIKTKNHVS